MTTLDRLLDAVFGGDKFESMHPEVDEEKIFDCLSRLPYSLSKSQRSAIYRALRNDVSYIQGPPGTGKSFTISALTIAASELGLKVVVASQKTPAVDIVYDKVTEILGDAACLYVSDDPEKKRQTKATLERLINKATDYQTSREEADYHRLSSQVRDLIKERGEYAKRIQEYESDVRKHYDSNQAAIESRKVLEEDYELQEECIRRINLLHNRSSCEKSQKLLDECMAIREKGRINGGSISLAEAVRLQCNSNAVLRLLDLEIELYKKHKEEALLRALKYSTSLANAQRLQRVVAALPLEAARKNLDRRNLELYPKSPRESTLTKYLKAHHSVRVNNLLRKKEYKNTLDAFYRRLRWKSSRKARKANSEVDYKRLFEIFPILMGEIKALHPYLPFEEECFDLLILDEASQVNLAEIFPILYRAKRFCIVGDHKQLGIKAGGVIFVSKVFEKLTWQKHFATLPGYPLDFKSAHERDLLVSESSILDLIRNDQNRLTAAPVLLNEHFRSLPMLAEFTSEQFYKDENPEGLRIMTAVAEKKALNGFADIEVASKRESSSKINKGEVDKAFEVITSFAQQVPTELTKEVFRIPQLEDKAITVGVVCFIRDQVKYMNDEALKRLSDEEQGRISLMIGTPEEFQGNERDVMIFTPAIDEEQTRSKTHMEDAKRFNVATSRARYFTYFIHGKLPSNMLLMQQMLSKMGQGKAHVQDLDKGCLPIGWTYKKSECESDFELIVADVLEDIRDKEYKDRLVLYNQVRTCGYRLDFVVYDRHNKRALGVEVDGKHHYLDDGSSYTDEHLERANALKRADWSIKYLPYWNWFQDGWIERDAPAANELRQSIRDFFAD
ncbi:MAG: hypothetical protein EBZ48_03900 [Proteobacteria bacterium]|nr:hypothetical protein [Pseudomonadota bacterium]